MYTVLHPPRPSQPRSHGCERKTVAGGSGQPQPAVTVAGTTHAAVTHVLQMSVVDTTGAHPGAHPGADTGAEDRPVATCCCWQSPALPVGKKVGR